MHINFPSTRYSLPFASHAKYAYKHLNEEKCCRIQPNQTNQPKSVCVNIHIPCVVCGRPICSMRMNYY